MITILRSAEGVSMKVEHAKQLDKQDQRLLAFWAADCAEHVLPYFEENYPEDDRPRKAIEAGRAWARGEIACGQARAAANAVKAVTAAFQSAFAQQRWHEAGAGFTGS